MLQPRTTTAPVFVALAAHLLAAACAETGSSSSSSSSSGSTSIVTSISIDPADFLDDVPCEALPGAMQSYVATITDRTDPARAFTLPSSPPTSCSQRVFFRYVLAGHSYTATVDGYEQPPPSLAPLGGQSSGSPHMLAAGSTDPVEPRWTTACGEQSGEAAVAASHTYVSIKHCSPLSDHEAPDAMAIVVSFASSVMDAGCAAAGGRVTDVDLTPIDSMLPPVSGIPCMWPSITYTSTSSLPLVPGRLYTFYLQGSDVDPAHPGWGALCFATPQAGLTEFAVCDPLSSTGAITVDPGPSFASKGYLCPEQISTYRATLLGGAASVFVPCDQSVRFDLLTPGDYDVAIEAPIVGGSPFTASCTQVPVQPGRTTQAACSAD